MHKINITEKNGNRSNEALPAWYKEKVKVMSEIIMKKHFAESFDIASSAPAGPPRNDRQEILEVVR